VENFEGHNHSEEPGGTSSIYKAAIGWGIVSLVIVFVLLSNNRTPEIAAGMGLKLLATITGLIGGITGAMLGDAIRRFAKPDMMFTSGGFGALLKTKLFWMIGPQSIGVFLGTALGQALFYNPRRRISALLPLAFLSSATLLPACSDSPPNQARDEFMLGCTQNAPEDMCTCAYDKLAQQYSPQELEGFSKGKGDINRFYTSVAETAMACRR